MWQIELCASNGGANSIRAKLSVSKVDGEVMVYGNLRLARENLIQGKC
jgi:hypothetical protein